MSKSKPPAHSLQQTSTHHMAATQIDSRIAATVPHQKRAVPPVTSVQAPQEALQNRRPSGPTSAPLKFLPKGALKVAQTHTSIQRSQIPPPPPKLQAQSENPFQTQQQMPRQYEQQSSNSDQDENFEAQVRIEAERQEAILREAYRIAEGKIRKEREEAENKSAVNTGYAAKEAAKTLVAQIAEELAATEELISKEREILELRKKELREIRESAEKETGSAKSQENKIILLPPQKPVKLKSGEGSEILMRSSKNLQIDKKMLQTGRLVLNKKELEKKDSKPELTTETEKDLEREKSTGSGIVKIQVKGKTSTKIGINTATPVTNITLVKIQKKKKTIILFIVGLAVAVACILIFFIGGAIARKFKSSFSTSPVAAPPALTQDKLPASVQSGKKTGSPLQMEYNELYQKIRKMPANRQEVDNNIREWQDFIDSHPNATDTDKCIKDAKAHIKDMQNMKELY